VKQITISNTNIRVNSETAKDRKLRIMCFLQFSIGGNPAGDCPLNLILE